MVPDRFGAVNKQTLAATTLAVAATAGIGSVASRPRTTAWYARLRKPSYVPPSAVFPVAWTSLYAIVAVTTAMAINKFRARADQANARRYVVSLGINLLLNSGWSWLFFRFHKLGGSAAGAAVLAASSADLTRRTIQADTRAGLAQLPYPAWCAFATAMSTAIWRLNR